MKDFWKNPAVKNYLVEDIFDIDEIVRRFGGCPDDEDYKIVRSYYCDEFVGGEEGYETSSATKEDYEKYKSSDEDYYDFSYRTELNYNDFLDKFWFDTFEQTLYEYVEPDEQIDFITYVNETFFTLSFEGQGKLFLRNIIKKLNHWSAELLVMIDSKRMNDFYKINKIQEKVIKHYSGSYLNTKRRIINHYKFIYSEIENDFMPIGTEINTKLTRDEILNKLVGDNSNKNKFYEYEKKLKTQKYLSKDSEWIKNPVDFSRFYSYCLNKTIFKSYFLEDDNRGIDFLRNLFNFHRGKSIDSPAKRKKQLIESKKTQFNFLDTN
ncbi:hypothetical protein [Flavobacterium sp. RSP15]|uniref:hypothetical protein n=1 Tax=Flavobacterium sp. RSP15 TaxID=2497485 RepID=UPI000F823C98|nr:hypothetical protein [Flavobacterium sp. RSP15]RTY86338.1 hypothetical protein EKM00_10315 [Flavobacterium sp. RSP15]